MSVNTVTLTGYVARDLQLQATKSGLSVLNFAIGVNERKKQGDTWVDVANFFECSVFGKRAETLPKYIGKGSKVTITGKLQQQRWEKDGRKHSRVIVLINDIEFMSKQDTNPTAYSAPYTDASPIELADDDIPF